MKLNRNMISDDVIDLVLIKSNQNIISNEDIYILKKWKKVGIKKVAKEFNTKDHIIKFILCNTINRIEEVFRNQYIKRYEF